MNKEAKKRLVELADSLDSKGLTEEANVLDRVIGSWVGDMGPGRDPGIAGEARGKDYEGWEEMSTPQKEWFDSAAMSGDFSDAELRDLALKINEYVTREGRIVTI